MKIDTIKRSIMLCHAAGITPFIWGVHGIGKSSLVRQITEEGKMGLVDYRCALCEASDLTGLPDKVNGKTVYLPPERMPTGRITWKEYQAKLSEIGNPADKQDPEEAEKVYNAIANTKTLLQPDLLHGILFLDELNRAQSDVIQAAFQLVLDRSLGRYVLPKGWNIVAAGNYNEGAYITNNFNDPAFLSRFCHLELSSDNDTMSDWISYMIKEHDEDASTITEFAGADIRHLYGESKKDNQLGFHIEPDPRHWEAVLKVEKVLKTRDYGEDARIAVLSGLVGGTFQKYKSYETPIKPLTLLGKTKEQIIHALKTAAWKGRDIDKRQQIMALILGYVGFANKKPKDKTFIETSINFVKALAQTAENSNKELAVLLMQQLLSEKIPSNLKASLMTSKNVAGLLSQFITKNPDSFMDRVLMDKEIQETLAKVCWGNDQ